MRHIGQQLKNVVDITNFQNTVKPCNTNKSMWQNQSINPFKQVHHMCKQYLSPSKVGPVPAGPARSCRYISFVTALKCASPHPWLLWTADLYFKDKKSLLFKAVPVIFLIFHQITWSLVHFSIYLLYKLYRI